MQYLTYLLTFTHHITMKEQIIIQSLRKAVDAHCKSCVYDPQSEGSWRHQVESCSVTQCELYPHRPVTIDTRNLRAKLNKAT
jgi:hypothetical protein